MTLINSDFPITLELRLLVDLEVLVDLLHFHELNAQPFVGILDVPFLDLVNELVEADPFLVLDQFWER